MERLRIRAAYTVITVWVISMFLKLLVPEWEPDPSINWFAGAAVTLLFGAPYVFRGRRRDNGD